MGRRLVRDASGEEAVPREIALDRCDGGAAENIIIEGGPRFAVEVNEGGELHCLDQAVLLGLCLDVANSNPIVRYLLSASVDHISYCKCLFIDRTG